MSTPRIIGHLDMDAFFAAIEERDTPRFRGLPLVVGADPRGGRGRGVVSTASYAARAYGIRSAMPISVAWRLAEAARRQGQPATLFLPGDFRKYEAVSERIIGLIRRAVPVVQQRSVDEAYLDLSFAGSMRAAATLCRQIKREIWDRERLTASVGIGPNKLIAKIASDLRKPDGFVLVEEGELDAFLGTLPIRAIPGIGPKTEAFLRQRGLAQVRDLQRLPKEELSALLGKWGLDVYEKVRGRDDSPVTEEHITKSIGAQVTFDEDTRDIQRLVERLTSLCEDVLRRLHAEGFREFRTVVLTVRFADFRTTSRASTTRASRRTLGELRREVLRAFLPFLDARENPARQPLRLVGVRVEKLG